MKKSTYILIPFISIFLSAGCSHDHIYYGDRCLTCMDSPITGRPVNYDPHQDTGSMSNSSDIVQAMKGEIILTSRLDVDSAYARAMQIFRLRSPERIDKEYGGGYGAKLSKADAAWMHERVPGSRYELSDYGHETLNGQRISFLLGLTITKNGSGCNLILSYSPLQNSAYDGDELREILAAKAEKLLR